MKDTMELEIDFGQMLRVLKKRAKYIILLTMVCAVLGMAVAVTTPPKYRARTQMIVNAGSNSPIIESGQLASSLKLVETCAVLICSRDVLQPIIDKLELPETCESLAKKISVKSINETMVMEVVVTYSDPVKAKQIVEQIIEIAPPNVKDDLEGGDLKPQENSRGDAVEIKKGIPSTMIKYAAVGFVLSAALFIGLFLLDNTFHTERELSKVLDLPVLGVIPSVESCHKLKSSVKKGRGILE